MAWFFCRFFFSVKIKAAEKEKLKNGKGEGIKTLPLSKVLLVSFSCKKKNAGFQSFLIL